MYARVSTEDQAERQTVQGQVDFLRQFAALHGWTVVGEYVDDGISGTVPLERRPDGRRLLADAQAGKFGAVIVYRLDRLGRRASVLLDAHDALRDANVGIKSGKEQFDTSTPYGTFVFQLLGSIAELERSTIAERTRMGRDRVARDGQWLGCIPFGYMIDAEQRLIPSTRRIAVLDCTEAELLADLYARIAGGSSVMAECRRLNALGVPPPQRRYTGGAVLPARTGWAQPGLALVLHNPVYYGEHTLHSAAGPIVRQMPALVSVTLWRAAQAQMTRNRRLSKKNAKRDYLLRGLVRCGGCHHNYTGATVVTAAGRERPYYRCSGEQATMARLPGAQHAAKRVRVEWLDALVWADCRDFAEHPDSAIEELQHQLAERRAHAGEHAAELRALRERQAEHEEERKRVRQMRRRGRMSMAEAEEMLDEIDAEAAQAAELLRRLERQDEAFADEEARHADIRVTLRALREKMAAAEDGDPAIRRAAIEQLVEGVEVVTEGTGRGMTATVQITYRFGEARVVEAGSRTATHDYYPTTLGRSHPVVTFGTLAS